MWCAAQRPRALTAWRGNAPRLSTLLRNPRKKSLKRKLSVSSLNDEEPLSESAYLSSDSTSEDIIPKNGVFSVIEDRFDRLPGRFQIVGLCCLAFMLCNMDKVNLSISIIPMAAQYDWPSSVSGLVQSSFFWGYLIAQLPGGFLCSRFGGRRMIPVAVGIWSVATAAVPLSGGTISGLCLARAAVGLGEAVAPSAITDMVAKTVPIAERSRVTSFIFAGLSVGSIAGLFLSSFLIEALNWESVFVLFAVCGGIWIFGFEKLMDYFSDKEKDIVKQLAADPRDPENSGIPVRAILRSSPVRALAVTHFCANYFHYTMLTWLPTYFSQSLSLNLNQVAAISVVPPILSITFAAVAGTFADKLIEMGWETTKVRKICQTVAFLGPATCLVSASMNDDPVWSAGFVTFSLGLASFSMSGLYCNHQDLSPKYSSFLIGLTNTVASLPGIFGVWLTGYLLETFDRWDIALLYPPVLCFVLGTGVFLVFGSSQEQSFSNNKPFQIESRAKDLFQSWKT